MRLLLLALVPRFPGVFEYKFIHPLPTGIRPEVQTTQHVFVGESTLQSNPARLQEPTSSNYHLSSLSSRYPVDPDFPQPHPRPVDAFYGIPFASPPTGELRFRPPQPYVTQGMTRRDAGIESMPAHCSQPEKFQAFFHVSEDCLYLNVYRPAEPVQSYLPVLVFLYDGRFITGGAGDEDYPALSSVHDVVFVAINYRVGPLGFLASQAVKNEVGTTGNMGVQDQQMALRWIQTHISAFGGDPNRVGIWGVSAGGMSVLWHMVSEESAGLFHTAIMSSGSAQSLFFQDQEDSGKMWDWYARDVIGCLGGDDLVCLRSKPAEVFQIDDNLMHTNPATWAGRLFPLGCIGMTVDGSRYGTKAPPMELIRAGKFNNVPLIVGTTKDEGSVFEPGLPYIIKNLTFPPSLGDTERLAVHAFDDPKVQMELLKLYEVDKVRTRKQEFRAINKMLRDGAFACSAMDVAEGIKQYGGTVFTYSITESMIPKALAPIMLSASGVRFGDFGAFHASDRMVVLKAFSHMDLHFKRYLDLFFSEGQSPSLNGDILMGILMTTAFPEHFARLRLFSDVLSCLWISHVSCGTPNCLSSCPTETPYIPEWPEFNPANPQYMALSSNPVVKSFASGFKAETEEFGSRQKCQFFRENPFTFFDIKERYGEGSTWSYEAHSRLKAALTPEVSAADKRSSLGYFTVMIVLCAAAAAFSGLG